MRDCRQFFLELQAARLALLRTRFYIERNDCIPFGHDRTRTMKTLTFAGSTRTLTAGKLICLGRNYVEHAKEMAAEVPTTPVLFLKPSTALIGPGETVLLPPFSSDLHHEVEMVVLIGREGKDIPEAEAMSYVAGYAVGLDMTLRDVQAEAKKKGLPWSVAKGFDTSAPVSPFADPSQVPDPHNLDITLTVNGAVRQHSNTGRMIFRLDRTIAYISTVFTLEPGDLIFTGTPEGVAQVKPGDTLTATLQHVGTLTVTIGQRR